MADALETAKLNAQRTCNAAADAFDAEPLAFWSRYGIGRSRLPGVTARRHDGGGTE